MSISLRSVSLSNIRHHENFLFEPASEGVTAIRGATGAGKSSIVDSVAWVLFGVKPRGVSKNSAIMRDQAKWGEDKFFASVVLNVDDTVMKVERRIVSKSGSAECDVWEAPETEDGSDPVFSDDTHKAGSSVTSAEIYIRQRLKMDSKGFLAAVLVQQKQVDSLVTASPSERAQVIEKLTGISSATAALKKAREESTSIKKSLASTSVDEDEATRLHKEIEELSSKIDSNEEKLIALRVSEQEAQSDKDSVSCEYNSANESYEQQESIRQKASNAKAQLESLRSDLDETVARKNALKAEMKNLSGGVVSSLDDAQEDLSSARSALSVLQRDLKEIDSRLSGSRENLSEFERILSISSVKDLDAAIQGRQKTLDKIDEAKSVVSESTASIRMHESEERKLSKAVDALTGGEGTCPTCLQKVDSISVVLDKLNKEIEECQNSVGELKKKVTGAKRSVPRLQETVGKYDSLIEAIENREKTAESIKSDEDERVKVLAQIKVAETEVKSATKILVKAKEQDETRRKYESLLDRASEISDRIEQQNAEIDRLSNQSKNTDVVSLKKVQSLRIKVDKAVEAAHKAGLAVVEVESEQDVLRTRLESSQKTVERLDKEIEKYRNMLRQAEESVSTTGLIERFREARIEDSVPVIEEYASDLISRFTSGKFVRLEIDKKFNASVVLADGRKRPVGMLSGGEMSAAAIALRIAISMLLNGGTSRNLIILDEVLVSQDYSRAEAIIETIKEVCKGQVVVIAHNDSIDAHSDKVVEITA